MNAVSISVNKMLQLLLYIIEAFIYVHFNKFLASLINSHHISKYLSIESGVMTAALTINKYVDANASTA